MILFERNPPPPPPFFLFFWKKYMNHILWKLKLPSAGFLKVLKDLLLNIQCVGTEKARERMLVFESNKISTK